MIFCRGVSLCACMHKAWEGDEALSPGIAAAVQLGVRGVSLLFLAGKEMFSYKIHLLSCWLAWCLVKEE